MQFDTALVRTLLDATNDGVVITDSSGKVLNVNARALLLTGYTNYDVIGQPVERLLYIRSRDKENNAHPILEALSTKHTINIQSGILTTKRQPDRKIEGSVTLINSDHANVLGAVLLFRDLSETHKMAEQVHHYATFDQLTGLVNRHTFEQRLQKALDSAVNEKKLHTLCYLDLDQFKIINDTCGHAVGDELLRQIGILLANHIWDRDTLSRIGGDEFGLLLENCSIENAVNVAETLRKDIENFSFTANNRTFQISTSIGLVVIDDKATSINTLLAAADQACYAAKESGRNSLKVYTESDEQLLLRSNEMLWVSRLHEALQQDHFLLYGQPIVSTGNSQNENAFNYYELLIRLRDKDGSVLPPGAFMPAAERYGLATAIDQWVIEHYFLWLSNNPQHAKDLMRVSINLSGQSLSDENLYRFIREQIEEFQLPANKLCFEITETAAIYNLADALKFIGELRSLGVTFALDDFGTGMSSFSYLKQLPIELLKIDGSFIKDVLTDQTDASIVKNIVEIGNTLGMKTIAEYVENAEIFEYVKNAGVNYAQGDGICAPIPIDDL